MIDYDYLRIRFGDIDDKIDIDLDHRNIVINFVKNEEDGSEYEGNSIDIYALHDFLKKKKIIGAKEKEKIKKHYEDHYKDRIIKLKEELDACRIDKKVSDSEVIRLLQEVDDLKKTLKTMMDLKKR